MYQWLFESCGIRPAAYGIRRRLLKRSRQKRRVLLTHRPAASLANAAAALEGSNNDLSAAERSRKAVMMMMSQGEMIDIRTARKVPAAQPLLAFVFAFRNLKKPKRSLSPPARRARERAPAAKKSKYRSAT
jgi:hypothetical protein